MYKLYFKQAVAMLKQNKFISFITIVGTALAIMMIMVIVVTQSIKNTDIAPEVNRDRTLYLKWQTMTGKGENKNVRNSYVYYNLYKNYLAQLKEPELITALCDAWDKPIISAGERSLHSSVKCTDVAYWRVMSFSFVEGSAFTQDEFDAGSNKAVITARTAQRLFGNNASAVGKTIQIDFNPYTVAGVIKNVSPVFEYAYADAYVPYTTINGYDRYDYKVLFVAKNKSGFAAINNEIREVERKYNATDSEWNVTFSGPYNHKVQQLDNYSEKPNVKASNRKLIFVLAVLFLIPAINLSGFSISRVRRRVEEIGVRKAFGAKKQAILLQILYENFITTLIGGGLGLVLSYVVVLWLKKWLLGVEVGGSIPIEALVSLPVFVGVFAVCVLLNLLSAAIPAFKAANIKIVDSLNRNNA